MDKQVSLNFFPMREFHFTTDLEYVDLFKTDSLKIKIDHVFHASCFP